MENVESRIWGAYSTDNMTLPVSDLQLRQRRLVPSLSSATWWCPSPKASVQYGTPRCELSTTAKFNESAISRQLCNHKVSAIFTRLMPSYIKIHQLCSIVHIFDVFIYLKCSGNEQVFLEFDDFLYFNIYNLIIFFKMFF